MNSLTAWVEGRTNVIVILTVLVAIQYLTAVARAQGVESIVDFGAGRSFEEAQKLEVHLRKDPNDVMARLQLYGFYLRNQALPEATESEMGHALWLIEHRPRSAVHRTLFVVFRGDERAHAFNRGRDLWLRHLGQNEEDLGVIEHAGLFLRGSDPELAKSLFSKGRAAEPQEPRWLNSLGRLSLRAMEAETEDTELKKLLAAEAFKFLREAYELSTESGRNLLLPQLCQSALHSEQFGAAEEYAQKMLQQDTAGPFGYLKNHYHGHTVLGVLKFVSGDIDGAKRLLMRSVNAPASRRDLTGQPDFSLLRRFIEHGDSETAIEFLKACESVWKNGRAKLRDWQEILKKGEPLVFAHPGIY